MPLVDGLRQIEMSDLAHPAHEQANGFARLRWASFLRDSQRMNSIGMRKLGSVVAAMKRSAFFALTTFAACGGHGKTSAVDVMTACSSAQDCMALSTASNSVYCCSNNSCVADQPDECTDANVQLIQASNYDQSCKTNSDCVSISEGNACDLLPCCPNATISKGAFAQYQSDLAKTRLGSCSIPPTYGCSCGTYDFCCLNGSCQWDVACSGAPLAADANPGRAAGDAGEESTE
jgi:hypothetical protein